MNEAIAHEHAVDDYARVLAFNYGDHWKRLSIEEREAYREQAERALAKDELPNCVWAGAEYPFCKTY